MPALSIYLDGDSCWPDLRDKMDQVIHLAEGSHMGLAALPGGMSSGKTSVCFRFDLPDGRTVLAETSFALLAMGVDAIRARYGQ